MLRASRLGPGLEMKSCNQHSPAQEIGIIPYTETLNPLRRVLTPCLASSSPSSQFRNHWMLQGQGGSHRPAFSRPVCHQGYTAVSIGKPNYRCDKWEKSSPCCPKRSGKEGGCSSFTAKPGHSLAEDGGVNHKLSRKAPVICICCIWYLRVLLSGCSSSVLMQKWWSADKAG